MSPDCKTCGHSADEHGPHGCMVKGSDYTDRVSFTAPVVVPGLYCRCHVRGPAQ